MFDGGGQLRLRQGATSVAFAGSGSPVASEEQKRELILQQDGLLGLRVIRKVYVPRTGYFLRYLDTLRNDGPEPVSVDVAFETPTTWDVSTVGTSSGDLTLDAGDRWVAFDGAPFGVCDFRRRA